LLRGARVELADCVSQPLKVPAEAEIVLEGEVSLIDYRDEGPFGDHTATTIPSSSSRCSRHGDHHAAEPIYLSTYTGRPPDEPSYLERRSMKFSYRS